MHDVKSRILVIDDQDPILENFARLLEPTSATGDVGETLDELEVALGGAKPGTKPALPEYRVRYARQGEDGVRDNAEATRAGDPFSMAFVDVHMPPGIDGIETVARLWRDQPDLEIVLCTAYSNYSWHEILDRLPARDQFLILRKPFEPIEVRQLAACLTEKSRRGRALARRMEELQAKVTIEVTRRMQLELDQSHKFEALGRLAAGVAHEINTPTQSIRTNLEYLEEVCVDVTTHLRQLHAASTPSQDNDPLEEILAEAPAALQGAMNGVERVAAIVRSIRDYAHTSNENDELVDINREVRMAAELARSEYKNDADLVLELPELPPVRGYADAIGRTILNLIINAAHAVRSSGRSRGVITVTTASTTGAITIDVADTGTGIAPEHRARVFEPFFTTKPQGLGTGQGLALARATIVDKHHGSLTFDTITGSGTTFRISLPRVTEPTLATVPTT